MAVMCIHGILIWWSLLYIGLYICLCSCIMSIHIIIMHLYYISCLHLTECSNTYFLSTLCHNVGVCYYPPHPFDRSKLLVDPNWLSPTALRANPITFHLLCYVMWSHHFILVEGDLVTCLSPRPYSWHRGIIGYDIFASKLIFILCLCDPMSCMTLMV